MLEFIEEELSGQLVAHSETTPFKTYWIDVQAWHNLQAVYGSKAGVHVDRSIPFNNLEDAKAAAQEMEQ